MIKTIELLANTIKQGKVQKCFSQGHNRIAQVVLNRDQVDYKHNAITT